MERVRLEILLGGIILDKSRFLDHSIIRINVHGNVTTHFMLIRYPYRKHDIYREQTTGTRSISWVGTTRDTKFSSFSGHDLLSSRRECFFASFLLCTFTFSFFHVALSRRKTRVHAGTRNIKACALDAFPGNFLATQESPSKFSSSVRSIESP